MYKYNMYSRCINVILLHCLSLGKLNIIITITIIVITIQIKFVSSFYILSIATSRMGDAYNTTIHDNNMQNQVPE